MGDRKQPTPCPHGAVKPPPPPAPPAQRIDRRSGKPSWADLDAMYTEYTDAVRIIAGERAELDAVTSARTARRRDEAATTALREALKRAFLALGDGADHTICRALEAAEARIVELEAERDTLRARLELEPDA